MEGYAYSYPDSGDSSPRSREIDFENPPPSWEDQPPPPNHKVKFMVSYGGKIQPRSHDNQLAYVGGETKILAVDRSVKFSNLLSKLSSLIAEDNNSNSSSSISSFKYQLPGEELDALISVTNDDDLEHMMHEYDRLYRASSRPARLRLFAFPAAAQGSGFGSGSSEPGKLDRDRFVEALNSVPPPPVVVPDHHHQIAAPAPVPIVANHNNNNNVDFLFGLDNKGPVQPVQLQERVIGSDPQIDARIQELNRLQISAQEQQQQQQQPPPQIYRPKSDENFAGGFAGEAYTKPPPPTIPASVQIPAGYWQPPPPQQQQQQPPPPQQHQPQQQQQQPVYMYHAPPQANMYHAPMVRPVAGQPPQGYYQMQRVPSDPIYREQPPQQQQPVYNMAPPLSAAPLAPAPTTLPAPAKVTGYSEGMGVPVRAVAGMADNNAGGYTQVAYDSATGRQVYYAAPGGGGVVTAPFQGVVAPVAVSGGGGGGGLTNNNNVEGKGVTKVLPTSAAV